MNTMFSSRILLAVVLPLGLLSGCGDSNGATLSQREDLAIIVETLLYVEPCSSVEKFDGEWGASTFMGQPRIEITERRRRGTNQSRSTVQTIETPGFFPFGAATDEVPSRLPDSEDPILYVFGRNERTATYEVRMYPPGRREPVDSTAGRVLELPEAPVALEYSTSGIGWLATEDSENQLGIHRLSDLDEDGWLDDCSRFARLSEMRPNADSVLSRLDPGGFLLKHASDFEVLVVQDRYTRFRVVDRDRDGTGDIVLLPFLGNRRGTLLAGGIRPGSERVGASGVPRQLIEIWAVDAAGELRTLLATGQTNGMGRATLDLSAPLSEGDSIVLKHQRSSYVSDPITVVSKPRLDVLRLDNEKIAAGGTLDVAIEYFLPETDRYPVDEPAIRVEWVYMDREDWGRFRKIPCSLTRLDQETFRVHFPHDVKNPWAANQALSFEVGELRRAIRVRVEPVEKLASVER